MERIYLDYAAATPLDADVQKAMEPFETDFFGNSNAIHEEGRRARAAVESSRESVARILHAHGDEIVFTSGGTESNNLALLGLLKTYEHRQGGLSGLHVITTAIEHASVLDVCKEIEQRGVTVTYLPVDVMGMVNVNTLKEAIRPETILVSVMLANNEIGTIQPIEEIGKVVREARTTFHTHTPYLHTDASQAAPFLSIDVESLGVDLLSVDAQKMYGPKGVGALYVRRGVSLAPLFVGGKQEHGLRPGTHNTAGIVGLSDAYRRIDEQRTEENSRLLKLREYFIEEVETKIQGAHLNGDRTRRLSNNVNFSFDGFHSDLLVIALDEAGIACAARSACLSGGGEGSYVVAALDPTRAQSAVRFTLGRGTTQEEIDRTILALQKITDTHRPR